VEVTGGWAELHNDQHNLYSSSQNVVSVTKLGRMRRAWHVARMGELRNMYTICVRGKAVGKCREA